MDGVEVVFSVFRERVSPADQATGPGPQSAKPAFDVAGLTFVFAAATMRVSGKRRDVGIPVVAASAAVSVAWCQRGPQVAGALQASVAQGPADDLAGAATEGHPEPKLAGFATDKTPEFVRL